MPIPTVRLDRCVCTDRWDARLGQEISTDYAVGTGKAEVELSIPDDGSTPWACVNGNDFPVERLVELAANLTAVLEHPDVRKLLDRLALEDYRRRLAEHTAA